MWFGAFSGVPLKVPLSEKLNFKSVINSEADFSRGQKCKKNCILTLPFTFLGQLGSLITSGHAFS